MKTKEAAGKYLKTELETQSEWNMNYGRYERKKKPQEKQMIMLADGKTSHVVQNCGDGSSFFSFPQKAVHFIPDVYWESKFGFSKNEPARTEMTFVLVRDGHENKSTVFRHLFHEFLHQKSYSKFSVHERENLSPVIHRRRWGLMFSSLNKKTKDTAESFFDWLEEAVTTELTDRYVERTMDNDFIYYPERRKLREVIDEIYLKNTNDFVGKTKEKARKEIFDVFAGAKFTGRILKPMRWIRKTFGRNSIRELGKWTRDPKESH